MIDLTQEQLDFSNAVSRNDPATAREYLSRGMSPNFRAGGGLTPLHLGIDGEIDWNEEFPIVPEDTLVATLLAAGADPNTLDDLGRTPLDLAICETSPPLHPSACHALLSYGAKTGLQLTVEAQRLTRQPLHPKHISNLTAKTPSERYVAFVSRVCDRMEVWSLKNEDGWVLQGGPGGEELAPFWPDPEFAEACSTGAWAGTSPASIPLDAFMTRWLPGMARDRRRASIFPTPTGPGLVMTPEALRQELVLECEALGDDFDESGAPADSSLQLRLSGNQTGEGPRGKLP